VTMSHARIPETYWNCQAGGWRWPWQAQIPPLTTRESSTREQACVGRAVVSSSDGERMMERIGKEDECGDMKVDRPPVNTGIGPPADHVAIEPDGQEPARRKALPWRLPEAPQKEVSSRGSPSPRPSVAREVAIEAGTGRLEHLRRQIGAEVVGSDQ
jgi:hypothetical protein